MRSDNMNILKVNNYEEMSTTAAKMIVETIQQVENPVLGLATGSTPERLYELLKAAYAEKKVSFQDVQTFNLDEYVGLSRDDEQSYHHFMNEKLFKHVDLPANKTCIPDGLAADLEDECATYEAKLSEAGKVDLQILGLGLNGHIGFNEPGTSFDERTHVVALDPSTRAANARFFADEADVPTQAISMGIATILEAKQILLLVQGEKKAEILRKVVNGEVTEDVPASILQGHDNVTIITDIEL